jgi:hypothetical protein
LARLLGKYMVADLVEEKPKTQVWRVRSRGHDDTLGSIKWFGPWRQYCFFFIADVAIMSAGCLRDLASFLEELNSKHKK